MWRNSACGGLPFRTVALSATVLSRRAVFAAIVFVAANVLRVGLVRAIVLCLFFFMKMT
jgi:hypothetical protein